MDMVYGDPVQKSTITAPKVCRRYKGREGSMERVNTEVVDA